MKDNIVSLKERLMTFKINSIESDDLLTKFSISRIEEVLDAAFKKEKKDGKQIFRGWIIKALQLGWNLKEKSKEVKVIIHTKPEDSLYRRELEVKTKIAKEKIYSVKRSAEDVEKHYMDMIRGMLRVSSSKPESNREFAKRIAPNVLEIYSRSEA